VTDSGNRGATGWLWGAVAAPRERAAADADLLGRFVRTRDEAAFRELVRRLGPAVFGVCRRHLGDTADAEDAFQATFLVLARKAGTVRPPGRVAAWVYGVAGLAARKLRQARQRRRHREVAVPHPPDRPAPEGEMDPDLRTPVDEELGRLPDAFRLPILLCGLRGLTIAQAAGELGWPAGTVATRLRRGRAALRERLAKRGIALTAVSAAAGGWSDLAAGVPPRLIEQTVAAVAGGTLPPAVAALTSEVVTAMTWTLWRRVGVGLLVVAAAAAGAVLPGVAAPMPTAAPPGPAKSVPGDPGRALDRVEWDQVAGLLRQASVRREIGLSDDDYKALAEFRKERRATLKRQMDAGLKAAGRNNAGGPTEKITGQPAVDGPATLAAAAVLDRYQAAMRDLDGELATKAAAALKPAGVRRLKQAVLQAAGPRGLLDRVAVRELGLTAEQEDRIAAAAGPARSPVTAVFPDAWLGKAAQDRDALMEVALKVLTLDQRKRWEALVGQPLPTIDLLKAAPTSAESIAESDGE
jgi:RNA polymerase sigma factor (sigma-70 family)